jgi:uncharacterized membrane protein
MKISIQDKISIAIIVLMFIGSFSLYTFVPDKMPIHWNAQGEIDGYGNKFMGLFLFPIIITVVYLLFLFIPKISVYKKNLKSFREHFEGMKLLLVLWFTGFFVVTLLPSFGINFNMRFFIVPAISLLFLYIGYILKFTRRNYFFGIRTPWTLASDKVWEKTHKLGSKTFIANGLIFLTALINQMLFWINIILLLVHIFYLFFYSYFEWKKEKKK